MITKSLQSMMIIGIITIFGGFILKLLQLKKRSLLTFSLILILILINLIMSLPAQAFSTVKFYDGDNITILHGGIKGKVRLACTNAPELTQSGGHAARKALKALVNEQAFTLNIIGKDRIGRFIAEIISDRGNINKILVERGYVRFYNPSGKGCEGYAEAEQQARQEHLGLWLKI
jgi:micrococcal nuclease